MKKQGTVYVLDANVFMQAHRRWYAFAFHPGFWDLLLLKHNEGRVVSIDRVKQEILAGDELETWVPAPPRTWCRPLSPARPASPHTWPCRWLSKPSLCS